MTKVLDHGSVEVRTVCASDKDVLEAMLVSTGKDEEADLRTSIPPGKYDYTVEEVREQIKRNKGRINYLMRSKHGSPFEHNMFKFRVTAPIFILREWHRHRIGWSYNEQSGRYMELGDKWYEPEIQNIRTRVGKPGHYTYEQMEPHVAMQFVDMLSDQCNESYRQYQHALETDIAPEQARLFLHVNHYSSMYATCNARSLMAFLELRNAEFAQWEIQQYAQALEVTFAEAMPVTYQAFVDNGRIAP